MKTCFKCQRIKPLADFYKHPHMADGHLNKCKDCTKRDVKEWYTQTRDIHSSYERERNLNPERRRMRKIYEKRHRERNPEKYYARTKLKNAVRDGKIKRSPCIHCGNPKSQAHHHDYSQPLNVVWLCFRCHREKAHGQVVVTTRME